MTFSNDNYKQDLVQFGLDIEKLHIECKENPDGGGDITIEWDENDLALAEWTSWGEDKQKQFILDALTIAVSNALPDDKIEPLRIT